MSPYLGTNPPSVPVSGRRTTVFDDPTDAPTARAMALHRAAFFGKVDTLQVVNVMENPTSGPEGEELEWWMLNGEVVPVRTTPPPALTRHADARPAKEKELQTTPVLMMTTLPSVGSSPTSSRLTSTPGAAGGTVVTRVPIHWTAVVTIGCMVCGFVGLVWSLGAA